MSKDLNLLVKRYHAFYEVSPYYLMVEDGRGSAASSMKRVHAGFDVDVHGVNTKNQLAPPGPDPDYALGFSELKKTAEDVPPEIRSSCSLEVISFPSTVVLDSRDHARAEAMIRIRISHFGELEQSAGLPEQRALDEIETRLKALGIPRR